MFKFSRSSRLARSTAPAVAKIVWTLLTASALPSHAILFYDTSDSGHNTTAPTGIFENSGWQYEGQYGGYLGTMIAPQYFITAQHFGLQGATFFQSSTFNGVADANYTIDLSANGGAGYWDIAGTDLRIFKINEYFSNYAPLYTGVSEVGLTLVTMGLGGPRGADVMVSGTLHGWEHNAADGIARWGSNTVATIYPSAIGDLLTATFSATGTAEEATLSGGDSGGGVFVNDGGIWKLAGINYSVDGMFDTNNTIGDGSEFNAALFDRGGLYQGSDAFGWSYKTDLPTDNPSSMYASRISTSAIDIMSIATVPEPGSALLLILGLTGSLIRRQRVS